MTFVFVRFSPQSSRISAICSIPLSVTFEPLTLADEGGIETAANTGVDKETLAHMKNWMECTRSRNRKTNADIQAAYDHSVALCMTIAAINTGKKVTFDEKKQDVVTA